MAEKICQQQCRSHKALSPIFPNICCVIKRSTILQWLGPRGHLRSGCPRAALRRPFLCRQAAPGGSSTCWYTVLLASVVCNRLQRLPRRKDWDKPCQGTRKAGVWQLASQMWSCPRSQWGLSFPFHITTSLVPEGNSLPLGTVADKGPFKQVASIALFHFSGTETSWSVIGGTQPLGPVMRCPWERDIPKLGVEKKK